MKERPILFSGPMVRALLEGRKTQTRRLFKGLTPPYCPGVHSCVVEDGFAKFHLNGKLAMHSAEWTMCHHGQTGDRLWVKETFYHAPDFNGAPTTWYRADDPVARGWNWKPSIFMPRRFSRITLEIVNVRVERLQDISEADAVAEGVKWMPYEDFEPVALPGRYGPVSGPARIAFKQLWESINGPGSWKRNPWVWVVEFKR